MTLDPRQVGRIRPWKRQLIRRIYARAGTQRSSGRWRNLVPGEARTKAQARDLLASVGLQGRRQRDGLEPMATDRTVTVGAVLRWWLETHVAGKSWAGRDEDRFRLYFQGTDLVALPVVALTAGRLELFLRHWSQKDLAPASVNKLRAMVRTAFSRARHTGLLHGHNPAPDTKPHKVPRRAPAFLESHEVPRALAELGPTDRPIVATALYAGLRKGELFGLEKRDVDLGRRLLTVRRSYDHDTNKGAREEAVPIASALVPYLEAALASSKGALLFPRPDGAMRTEEDKLGKRLRAAPSRAGIVEGYLHLCRRCKRTDKPHEERHSDCERRKCPRSSGCTTRGTLQRRYCSRPVSTSMRSRGFCGTPIHSSLRRPPKLDPFAALVLHEPPKAADPARGQVLEAPDSRDVQLARLTGVEPVARGFEVGAGHHPWQSLGVPSGVAQPGGKLAAVLAGPCPTY